MNFGVDIRNGRDHGSPSDQIAAIFDRFKLVLIGLASIGVAVVCAQLLLTEWHGFLALQLVAAILLWCALVFHNRLSTSVLVVAVYLTIFSFVLAGAANIGLAEPSVFVFVALATTSTVIWGLKAGFITLAVVLIVLVGLASRFLLFAPTTFDLAYFLVSPIRWVIFLTSISVSATWCILIVDLQRRYWLSAWSDLAAEIDQHRETENQLRLNEERSRILVQHAPEAITMLDAETGLYLEANPAAEHLHGYTREELVGNLSPWQLSPEFQLDGRLSSEVALENLNRAKAGQLPRFEWMHLDRNGQQQLCEVSLVSIPDPNNNLVRASITDITHRRATEIALQRAHRLEAMAVFSGGAAHDFNNQLAVIQGYAEMIDEGDVSNSELVDGILRAVERGSDLTRRLLASARQQPISPEVVDVGNLVKRIADYLGKSFGSAIIMECRVQDDAWPALVDVGQLEDGLLNLALNSRDAMPNGGRLIFECANRSIDATKATEFDGGYAGDFVRISVSDTGSGIDAAALDKVFEPFFTTKEADKGSGLGLATTYGFVKQSDGFIEVRSEVGSGTRIALYLPRAIH